MANTIEAQRNWAGGTLGAAGDAVSLWLRAVIGPWETGQPPGVCLPRQSPGYRERLGARPKSILWVTRDLRTGSSTPIILREDSLLPKARPPAATLGPIAARTPGETAFPVLPRP